MAFDATNVEKLGRLDQELAPLIQRPRLLPRVGNEPAIDFLSYVGKVAKYLADNITGRSTVWEETPKEYFTNPEGSVFNPRRQEMLQTEIQLKPNLAKFVRKLMQHELKRRGTKTATTELESITEDLLRGTWWRGQVSVPKPAKVVKNRLFVKHEKLDREAGKKLRSAWAGIPDFRQARHKVEKLKLGEPTGVSLSYDPKQAIKFAQKQEKGKLARVMPMYGGNPREKILQVWNEEHQKVLADAYVDTVRKMAAENPLMDYDNWYNLLKNNEEQRVVFNKLFTEQLQEKGWKGIFYHPDRWSERELKMFNPSDVMAIDTRMTIDKGEVNLAKSGLPIRYLTSKSKQDSAFLNTLGEKADAYWKTLGKFGPAEDVHLRDVYKRQDVEKRVTDLLKASDFNNPFLANEAIDEHIKKLGQFLNKKEKLTPQWAKQLKTVALKMEQLPPPYLGDEFSKKLVEITKQYLKPFYADTKLPTNMSEQILRKELRKFQSAFAKYRLEQIIKD